MTVLSPSEARQRIQGLLTPITPEAFFSETFGQKPVHLKGDSKRGQWLMNSTRLASLLSMSSIWNAQSLQLSLDRKRIPAEQYCLPMPALGGREELRPSASQVKKLLAQGASLICNDIDKLTSELNETADALEQVIGARVQANLYYSKCQRQAFAPHFDTHHVLAVHCEGRKTWNVWSQRAENPVPSEMFWQMTDEEHEQAKGELLFQAEMEPGDLLYLPRGQYHDALADSESSLHVTFGITRPTGIDWFGLAYELALRDGSFRADMPAIGVMANPDALRGHLQMLAQRLSDMAASPGASEQLLEALNGFVLPRERFTFDSPAKPAQSQDWSISF